MYVRVKRQKLTVFLQVEPNDTLGALKARLGALVDQVRGRGCDGSDRRSAGAARRVRARASAGRATAPRTHAPPPPLSES